MIYVLEDDNSIREFVVYTLCHMDLEARGFERPSEFWNGIEQELPSLILLDIMLPEEDGLSVLKKLRAKDTTKELPVIMLTARVGDGDKIAGLTLGADDYITKPFGISELMARVRTALRHTASTTDASPASNIIHVKDLTIDIARHTVTLSLIHISEPTRH